MDTCVIRSARPNWLTAATESPPPTTVVPLQSATAFAISCVPCANSGNSKTPMGPFQTTVFALRIRSRNSATVFGPMSMAILPVGHVHAVHELRLRRLRELRAHRVVHGEEHFHPGLLRLVQERLRRAEEVLLHEGLADGVALGLA